MGGVIFQGLNYLLAAAMYTLLARYVLALFFKPDSQAVIWRVFVQITDPILKLVRLITPRIVDDRLVALFAVVWTLLLRLGLYLLLGLAYAPAGGAA